MNNMKDVSEISQKSVGIRIGWTDGFEDVEIKNPSRASVVAMGDRMWETVRREILIEMEKLISHCRKMKPGTKRKFRIQPIWITVEKDGPALLKDTRVGK